MPRLSLLIWLFCIQFSVYSQNMTIVEKESQEPIPGVLVFGANSRNSAISDERGQVKFAQFEEEEIVYFQLFGYESISFTPLEIKAQNFQISLATSLIQMDQAVVSASRWRQNDHDIATKTRVLSSESLLIRNPSNSADWLGSSGEVFIQKSQQGGGSPMIRGFSANRLLYAVDGVRMNNAIFRSGNLHNVISLDPFSLQTTEVLFGPGSVMYGSDAIGGVMSFETLHPQFHEGEKTLWAGKISSRVSSANKERLLHGHVSAEMAKWAFLTSLTHVEYNDLKMGKNGPEEYLRPSYVARVAGQDQIIENSNPRVQRFSGYNQTNLMQKIRFQAGEKLSLDYAFHYSASGDIPRYDRLIQGEPDKLRFATWKYGPQIWMMNTLGVEWTKNTSFFDQAKIRLAQQYFEESRISRRFGSSSEANREEKVNAYSLNADFLKSLVGEDFVSYGIELVTNQVQSEGFSRNIETESRNPESSRYPDADWLSAAIYGTLHKQLSQKVKTQVGLRYNYTSLSADFSDNLDFFPLPFESSSSDFGALTGSLGVIYAPVKGLIVSPVFSTGFRAPNVDDIGKIFDSEPGAVLVPNPALKPEYAYNWELNINGRLNQRLRFELTGFYTLLQDALVRRPFTLDGESEIIYDGELSEVLAIQNAASAKVYGIQAGLEYSISPHVLFTSRYNWQKGEEELDDESTSPSRHAAPAFGLTRLTYAKNGWNAELSLQYSARVNFEELPLEEQGKPDIYALDENGNPYSPTWTILSFNTTYQLSEVITISGGIENITDQRYRPYSSGIVAAGRNFTLGIHANF
ncbi:TonB-dependent receptor [Algoriphagus namhaensis]